MRREMRMRRIMTLAMVALLGVAGCEHDAGGGHAAAEEDLPGGGSVTIWSDRTELFMEYPALLVGEPAKLLVHLTALSDFAPLRSGTLTLRFEPEGGGEAVEVVQDAPRSPGIYGPVVTLPRAGVWELALIIEGSQLEDRIVVPGLPVYAAAADLLPAVGAGGEEGIAFLKEQQWQAPGFRSAFAEEGSLPAGIEAPGEIVPAAGRYAEVSAPIAGLVDPEGASVAPAPGQTVEKGQILVVLTPALGESGSALASARAELRDAEQDFARAKRLFEVEAVPERRVDEARIRLDAAREAMAGLSGGGSVAADGRVTLRSPIAGVVARRDLAPGSRVEAGTLLLSIVDPSVVWLRAHVPVADAPRIQGDAGASFSLDGSGGSAETTRTVAVGSMVDPATRSVPVLYEVENPDGSIKIGAHVRATVRTGEAEEGVVIPDSAVLEEDGRPIAYVQAEGGERVVTGAAYQVRLASLSTAVPAHGHGH